MLRHTVDPTDINDDMEFDDKAVNDSQDDPDYEPTQTTYRGDRNLPEETEDDTDEEPKHMIRPKGS